MIGLAFKILLFSLISTNIFAALEYSKVDHPGCPENAFCQKATGEVRQKWIDQLEKFGKIGRAHV